MQRSTASNRIDTATRAFADDVAYYLTLTPRQLPSRYLYDELGSSLFEAICRLPWYPITRTELCLLQEWRQAIFQHLGPLSAIVELGPGNGEKLVTLMGDRLHRQVTVHLVDVSAAALEAATRTLQSAFSLPIVAHQATYEAGLTELNSVVSAGKTLVVFLGSNIGNFDPPGGEAFLRHIRAAIGRHDALLIGTDLVKPESDLLLAYDDPLGVTAAFNRNLLVRVNRELGGDFDISQFAHRALWNDAESRVEMHLISLRQQQVRVPVADIDITFERGDLIWTESSYKYRVEDVALMLEQAGFRLLDQWIENGFALTLAEAN